MRAGNLHDLRSCNERAEAFAGGRLLALPRQSERSFRLQSENVQIHVIADFHFFDLRSLKRSFENHVLPYVIEAPRQIGPKFLQNQGNRFGATFFCAPADIRQSARAAMYHHEI